MSLQLFPSRSHLPSWSRDLLSIVKWPALVEVYAVRVLLVVHKTDQNCVKLPYPSYFSLYYVVVQKQEEDKLPVGPWLLGLFIFVVCGSGVYFKSTLVIHIFDIGHICKSEINQQIFVQSLVTLFLSQIEMLKCCCTIVKG